MIPCCDFDGCELEGQVGLGLLRMKVMRWVCQFHLEALYRACERSGRSLVDQIRFCGQLARSRQHLAPALLARSQA